MKPSSIHILEKYQKHWHTLKYAGYVQNLEHSVKKELESVYQAEINPKYHENLWCNECVATMVRSVYTLYEQHLQSVPVIAGAAAKLLEPDPTSEPKKNKGQKPPKL